VNVRPTLFCVLGKWRQYRAAFEYKALGLSHHAIDNTALKQLPAGADHEPAESRQPAPLVQSGQEPYAVACVRNADVVVEAIGAGHLRARIRSVQPRASACSLDSIGVDKLWHDTDECGPNTTGCVYLVSHGRGHALTVVIPQHKPRLALRIDNIFSRAGNRIRRCAAVMRSLRLLRNDVDILRKPGSQPPECNGLVGSQADNQLGQPRGVRGSNPLRRTIRHQARRAIVLDLAGLIERNTLRKRAAVLGEYRDFNHRRARLFVRRKASSSTRPRRPRRRLRRHLRPRVPDLHIGAQTSRRLAHRSRFEQIYLV
jgi:hypothetical protein